MLGLGIGLWQNVAATSGGGGAWTPASLGSSLAADWTNLGLSHLFQDTAGTTPVTTDGQTVKCFTDTTTGIKFTAHNNVGWVYHANSGKPYLSMNGTEYFETPSITITDGSGQISIFATLSLAALSGTFLGGNLLYGSNLLGQNSSRVGAVAYSNTGSALTTEINFNATLATNTPVVIAQVTSTSLIKTYQDSVASDGTAVSGTQASAADAIHLGVNTTGNFYGLFIEKAAADATTVTNAETYMAALHP